MILLEFLLQRSGNFLFYIRHHSRYSNTFPAYIDCCVLIPVHSISACTLINAITQLQIFFYVSTAAAGFGTGIPAVNTDPFLPGTFHFICQKIREHSPAIVMNTLSKTQFTVNISKIYANDAITFIIPANTMTQVGFILVFRNKATHIIKIKTITHFVLTKVTVPFPQKAVIRIKIPADAIIATTAGRSECNTSCIISTLLYFRYNFANTVTIIQDGKMHPNVATTAPSTPAILGPTKVAELTAIGPGGICDIVIWSSTILI